MSDLPVDPAIPAAGEAPPSPAPTSIRGARSPVRLLVGCGVLALVLFSVPFGAWWWWKRHEAEQERLAVEAQTERAEKESAPALQKLADFAAPDQPYDIDQTIRVIHEIDLAMKDQASMQDYLQYMATRDYRGVAPEVLEARRRLLEQQARLYALQTEAEDQQASWEFSRDLVLQTLSVVQVSGGAGAASPNAGFSVDSAQARKLLDELAAKQAEHEALTRDIQAQQESIFQAMLDYSEVYYTYVDEWDRLCTSRDRAYLALSSGDWPTVATAARAAAAQAPHDKEAHLLLALALIEGAASGVGLTGSPAVHPEDMDAARAVLDQYVEDHPDATAPAFLLRGVLEEKVGNRDAARLDFQQSAAYYPKQAAALTDMLDPYRMRSWLRKSREGNYILDEYQASMLGAGYFSPDLQMAKLAFADGAFNDGKQKVMDHFARRRSQQQWNFILQDIQYAQALLGAHFEELFPEQSYVDLVVKPTLFGDKLSVAVNNRSNRALHNATLILVVHFTDTHPGDYEPFAAERTLPAVMPRETTDFGEMEVKTDLWGIPKSVADIVEHRAILLTDEAVLWVDTDAYKIAEAKEFRDAARANHPLPAQSSTWHTEMKRRLETTTRAIGTENAVTVEPRLGLDDDLVIELPATLAVFKPVFTLQYGGQAIKADTDVIEGDHIVLRFKGVADFEGEDAAPAEALRLTMESIFGEVVMDWSPAGGMAWRYGGAKAGE